jgi:hypothetical protein
MPHEAEPQEKLNAMTESQRLSARTAAKPRHADGVWLRLAALCNLWIKLLTVAPTARQRSTLFVLNLINTQNLPRHIHCSTHTRASLRLAFTAPPSPDTFGGQ